MASGDLLSSPAAGGGSLETDLAYYKSQYEQLEVELQEFQQSSKELEAELEKDIEASEKRERQLKEKVEALGFEVEEWKTKHKQSKTESNNAQNTLQKEITTLRDSNRTMQLKLRDIEVANDDFERQARNTTSSLEDLESKYNVAIERGVMLEEEIKVGEQERENLRIETQRLRDELSDLKIESEIVQEKLRNAEVTIEQHHAAKTHALTSDTLRPPSPMSETSTSVTTLSSPTASTPPAKSAGTASASATPPSPPLSETSANVKAAPKTPLPTRKRSIVMGSSATPKPAQYRSQRHSRGPSIPVSAGRSTPSMSRQAPTSKPASAQEGGLPRSGSLYQIRGLIGKMQKLEERVHSARSKLPAPTHTPPRASPRSGSALDHNIPATVTVRSRKRASGSTGTSSLYNGDQTTPTASNISRLSFGGAAPGASSSRPSSRASVSSLARPSSRSSMSGARTPLGHYDNRRPRSSLSGNFHSSTASVSEADEANDSSSRRNSVVTPSARRTELDKSVTGIPTPSGIPRRQSGGLGSSVSRRTSGGTTSGDMGPPERRRKLSEVGETF